MTVFEKPLLFITGAPRSGTSLLAKVLDAHPDMAILMENIFGNRRRHWQRPGFWDSPERLGREVEKAYAGLSEPILGNKVATPDVWDADDIVRFCRLFMEFRIVFIVRDPAQVALSRKRREAEDFFLEFNAEARKNVLIDFRSRFHAYVSSWRQSVETYWRLRDGFQDRVQLVYYEDLCAEFEPQVRGLLDRLGIPFDPQLLTWHERPHHDARGKLVRDLKYPDAAAAPRSDLQPLPEELQDALARIPFQYALWRQRRL